MLSTSVETLAEASASGLGIWPRSWQWQNYREVFNAAPFGRYFLNTFLVAGAVTAGVVVTSLLAGYAFARLQFPGRGLLFALILATMMIPFELALIPNFVIITRLGWYNSHAALIVPWTANAFSIFLLRQAFLAVPTDFFDAARVDGCGHLRFLVRIAPPLVKPALVTVGLFAFLGSYNSLLWPLVVTSSEEMRVVQVGLMAFLGDAGVRLHLLMGAATIVIAPTVLLYFLAQRHFIESALGAGIRG
jgi:ABC-type glycerol-3-phosphate transport system permease component